MIYKKQIIINIKASQRKGYKRKINRKKWKELYDCPVPRHMKVEKINIEKSIPNHNILKYWHIVRKWICKKYNISENVLETLLFLYDEPLFMYKQYYDFGKMMRWNVRRFIALKKDGYIIDWTNDKAPKEKKLYMLSPLGKAICRAVYHRLNLDKPMTLNTFEGTSVANNRYKVMIRKMNKIRKERLDEKKANNPDPLFY